MASASTTTNPELPRQSSICSLSTFIAEFHTHNHNHNRHSRRNSAEDEASSMDDLLKSIYSDSQSQSQPAEEVEEVWKKMVAGDCDQAPAEEGGGGRMTLEDYLTKSGAVREEDLGVGIGGFEQFQEVPAAVYGGAATPTPGRGKRRVVEEPLDKATQQKQRRMIKNRESAARSRERKQAYTVELEALVTNLEEENAKLLREEAIRKQERYQQLMKTLIPIVESKEKKMTEKYNYGARIKEEIFTENLAPETEKIATRVVLRRVFSMEW